jgi:hypothetical protein
MVEKLRTTLVSISTSWKSSALGAAPNAGAAVAVGVGVGSLRRPIRGGFALVRAIFAASVTAWLSAKG